MKILTIGSDINLFKPGSEVAKRAVKYGSLADKYIIINFTKKGFARLELSDRVAVYPTNSASKLFYLLDAFKLGKAIAAKEGIDVVSVQDPFEAALVGWWLKKKFKAGLNIQVHGDFFSHNYWQTAGLKNYLRQKLAKYLLPRADSVRAVSRRIASSLKQFGLAEEKITIAPIYVDWRAMQNSRVSQLSELTGQPFILSVGRLTAEKNLSLLIKAFAVLKDKHKALKLVIVGDGPQKQKLELIAGNLGLKNEVVFAGWQAELTVFYRSAVLLAVASQSEGYNRTVIEAMACGCPVVMSNVGLAGEILINGENGLVYEVGDKSGLIKSMDRLITEADLKEKLVAGGFSTLEKLPSEEAILGLIRHSWQQAMAASKNHGK